ncbi:MAG: hydroxymethylglutaryl-CoA reductase [Bacteroidia bacterium]
MATTSEKARKLLAFLSRITPAEQMFEEIHQKAPESVNDSLYIPAPLSWSKEAHKKRLEFIANRLNQHPQYLTLQKTFDDPDSLRGNIENYIGMTQVPTGIIGPLMINGTEARGEFYVPLATTEGAMVASYNRGAKACRLSGGITSVCLTEAVQRTPIFKFNELPEVGTFLIWVLDNMKDFQEIVAKNSRYAKLLDLKLNIEGNQVLIIFEYSTGDAAGQNMVTLCTEAVCQYIVANAPIKPQHWYIESNYSGDKKATTVSFSSVRGKKVTAEISIPEQIVVDVLRSTPQKVAQYWQSSTVASVQSGAIGIQGHFANGLTALFMACGQDVACVSEAAVGITRMEVNKNGDLYAAVTLPNLIVGTVGGGTHLPTQRECLEILDCYGEGKARKFAEICGATVLAGELSIAAALSSGQFAKAHKLFGRKK